MRKKTDKKLQNLRHSVAHLLAAAVTQMWPKIKTAIGPATADGFYYDFDFEGEKITEEDLPKIEEKMHEIAKSWSRFEKGEINESEARKRFSDNKYKLELIDEIVNEGEGITVYTSGSFSDLCAGGHIDDPDKKLRHFKLTSIAGAYWRGDEKNKMLTRIYGTAFETKKKLKEHLKKIEEAKERDHRKIGQEMDLFAFSELVGAGLPLYTQKGTVILNELYKALLQISQKYGVQEVRIPHMAKIELYETSGHAEKFRGELFYVKSHYDTEFVLKPVNCPHHTQIYASRPRSYRDLPIRFIESTVQHRDEKPGQIGGLTRTRSFMVDDGHTFCTVEQIKEEALNTCKIIEKFYKSIGLWGKHWVSLSLSDPKDRSKYIGERRDWEKAEQMIREISDELELDGEVVEGEAAIYGPKIDYMFEDALDNERQLATVQIDFAMPKRFGLTYTDSDGTEKTPVMLHRAILGSYERFLAILIEHFSGRFPLWLAPVQVKLLPISEKYFDYAQSVEKKLKEKSIRVELDESSSTLQAKIRLAQTEKVPFMVIVGEREEKRGSVSLRDREGEDRGEIKVDKFVELAERLVLAKSLELA